MKKTLLSILLLSLMIVSIFALSSCENLLPLLPSVEDEIYVSEDGYLVVNGTKTEHKVDKEDVITVEDGYLVVNGVKTGYKIDDGSDTPDDNACTHAQREENRVEATCEKAGYYDVVTYCTKCGIEFNRTTVTLEKLAHKVSDWIIDTEATCIAEGSRYKECTECGTVLYREVISATGNHSYDTDGKCTVCGNKDPNADPDYSVGLEYTSNGDGTCYVSGIGTCEDTNIVIPSISPEGLTVIGIGENAFYNCKSISYVEFPNTLKEIGAHAFENCWGLQSIDIPYGVVRISEYAFNECSFAKSLSIPDSVTNIGAYAFGSCRSITTLSIPKGIDKIECYTFGAVSALQILKIPDNIKVIEDLAFAFIYSLDNVIISDSVTSIGRDVFLSSGISKGKPIDIFYEGTFEEWTQIIINPQNDDLTNATMYYYSVTAPTTEGNFWHYVNDVPTIWDAYVAPTYNVEL